MDDIRKLLGAGCEPETVALHLAQAKCRLFPILIGQPFIESTALAETDESKIQPAPNTSIEVTSLFYGGPSKSRAVPAD